MHVLKSREQHPVLLVGAAVGTKACSTVDSNVGAGVKTGIDLSGGLATGSIVNVPPGAAVGFAIGVGAEIGLGVGALVEEDGIPPGTLLGAPTGSTVGSMTGHLIGIDVEPTVGAKICIVSDIMVGSIADSDVGVGISRLSDSVGVEGIVGGLDIGDSNPGGTVTSVIREVLVGETVAGSNKL